MGRHGTGGSDDGDERGNGSAFWGPDDPAEAPGWPALPDQVEVTGQWARMPRREDGPPQRSGRQPEPFETTGAFAVPADAAPGFPPPDAPSGPFPPPNGPQFSGSPYPDPNGAGPFEVTGAFARPADWDAVGPSSQPDATSAFGPPPSFDASGRTPGPFDAPRRNTGPFDAQEPGGTARFDMPGPGGTARFDVPEPGSTARFDVPGGSDTAFHARLPEPGDVKVAGEPTAAHTPAWAEAETGFLRSGWSSDQDLDDLDESGESRGRRRGGRRKSSRGGGGGDDDGLNPPAGGGSGKGRGRMALLSVAAVAVVLGGTVAGVKLMSSSDDPGKCAGASCAAVHTSTSPSTDVVADPSTEEEEPSEEPTEDEETSTPSDTPTTTAPTVGNRVPRRSTAPTPTPTRTRTKASAKPTRQPEPPAEETISEAPTDDGTSLGNSDTGVVPTVGSSPAPATTSTSGYGGSGGSVNVRQTVKQRLTSYSATLRVTNQSPAPLANATFSLPVEGRVMDVNGGSWTQDGDLLIIDLSGSLAAGDSVSVTYSATGKAQEPGACGLVGGECTIG
ncbi:hypothetical protein [Nonomuraea sp. NPDC049758]|uniref:hypothetical protein n=1 Tax=Nonomuraea sp. NPDC049758 TaxID=3154360 RepID=UPI00342E4F61